MSKKLFILIVLVVLVGAWAMIGYQTYSKNQQISSIKKEIEKNEEKGLYKNVVLAYDELLKLDDSHENYRSLSQNYLRLGNMDDYENALKKEIGLFPERSEAYRDLMLYYQTIKNNRKVLDLYLTLDENIQKDDDIQAVYEDSRYAYTYMSDSYAGVSNIVENNAVADNGMAKEIIDGIGAVIIPAKFEEANVFVNDYTGAKIAGEWFVVDREGDKIGSSEDMIETLGSFSEEGLSPVSIDGIYGYVDKSMKQYHMEYENATNFLNGVAAVQKDGKWALINPKFEEITDFLYEDIITQDGFCSRKGFIFAKYEGSYILLNAKGEQIGNETFEDAKPFVGDGPAAVKQNGYWGFVDQKGSLLGEHTYEDADSYNLGIAPVKSGGVYQYINQNDEVVIDGMFEEAHAFTSRGVAVVRNNKKTRMIQLVEYQLKES